jgi:4-amino-4-deoxy-L-arabinose transferase-like glycosyltransferase
MHSTDGSKRNGTAGHPYSMEGARDAGRTGDWPYTLALGLVGLVPRLFVAIAWAREPVWDGHYYHYGAGRIAAGLGYSEDVILNGHPVWKPWCHYPVGYSGFLGGVYRLFGSGLLVAPVANAIIGTLLVVVSYQLARHYLGETRARVAGALVALHPGLIAYTAVVMTEQLTALLLMTAGYWAVAWRDRWRGIVLAGVIVGLATLVRPASLLMGALLVFTQPRPWWSALLRASIATALAVLVVLPWTLRNCRVMDGCALVSTNGGWNLAIGALTETGRFRTLRAADGCPVVTGQVQQDRCWAEVGRHIIERDPAHWASLMPQKLAQTYDHESFAIEYLHEANPGAWPEARRVAGRQLLTLLHRLLLVVAALAVVARPRKWRGSVGATLVQGGLLLAIGVGAWFGFSSDQHPFFFLPLLLPLVGVLPLPGRPKQGPAGWFLLGLVAATSLTHAVFFGDDRYHLVVTPAFCLLAAAALRTIEKSRLSRQSAFAADPEGGIGAQREAGAQNSAAIG